MTNISTSFYVQFKAQSRSKNGTTTTTEREASLICDCVSMCNILAFFDDLNAITKQIRKAVKQNAYITITFGRYEFTDNPGGRLIKNERTASGSIYGDDLGEGGGMYLDDTTGRSEAAFWLDCAGGATLAENFKAFDNSAYYHNREGRYL